MLTVETARLGFIPLDADGIEAAMAGEKELEAYLGKKAVHGLIEPIHIERVFPIRLEKVRRNPENAKWYGFIVEKDSDTVIGMMGFKNPPDSNGLIEIGYGISALHRGNGYAFEMADALKEWAFSQETVRGITATAILKENLASIRIVEKLGMTLKQINETTVDYIILKANF